MLPIIFTVNRDYCFKQHSPVGLYNVDSVSFCEVGTALFKCYFNENRVTSIAFEMLTAVVMKCSVFWNITP
jgi:hypothetical protein